MTRTRTAGLGRTLRRSRTEPAREDDVMGEPTTELSPEVASILSRDSLDAAPALLGAIVSVAGPQGRVAIRLTEVEAYRGEEDPGSHAFRGRTARNASMFEAGGCVYVYFTYGMHHCLNIVTGPAGVSRAVLLRGGEVVEGLEQARGRRPAARTDRDLARGPARLCAALGLDRSDDGALLGGPGSRISLTLPEPQPAPDAGRIRCGPRTGVAGPGGDGKPSRGASGWMESPQSRRTGRPSPGDAHRTEPRRARLRWVSTCLRLFRPLIMGTQIIAAKTICGVEPPSAEDEEGDGHVVD